VSSLENVTEIVAADDGTEITAEDDQALCADGTELSATEISLPDGTTHVSELPPGRISRASSPSWRGTPPVRIGLERAASTQAEGPVQTVHLRVFSANSATNVRRGTRLQARP
jgi:hypothetical protein